MTVVELIAKMRDNPSLRGKLSIWKPPGPLDGVSGLYVVEDANSPRVKIGVSSNIRVRLSAIVPGGMGFVKIRTIVKAPTALARRLELAAHAHLASHRLAGEWFEICPELNVFVSSLAGLEYSVGMAGDATLRLTDRQKDVLSFVLGFWRSHHYAPALHEISAGVSASISTVRIHLRALSEAGCIEWNPMRPRTLRVTTRGEQTCSGSQGAA